jgi:hypothetical protein
MARPKPNPFGYCNSSQEVIRLAVMMFALPFVVTECGEPAA